MFSCLPVLIKLNMKNEIHEECGVFGVWGVKDAANLAYYGLHALQHRGQEACGIVCVDENKQHNRVKGEGLVTEVFNAKNLVNLKGDYAIAHVRYATAGGAGIENVQPFLFRHHTGNFALAHNGVISNDYLLHRNKEIPDTTIETDSYAAVQLIEKENLVT